MQIFILQMVTCFLFFIFYFYMNTSCFCVILDTLHITQCSCLFASEAGFLHCIALVNLYCAVSWLFAIYWHNYFLCEFSFNIFLSLLSFLMQFSAPTWMYMFSCSRLFFFLPSYSCLSFSSIRKRMRWRGPYLASSGWNTNSSCS